MLLKGEIGHIYKILLQEAPMYVSFDFILFCPQILTITTLLESTVFTPQKQLSCQPEGVIFTVIYFIDDEFRESSI
jgi:hypothetical protein